MKNKLVRVTTISGSLLSLLKGQLRFLSNEFDVLGVASNSDNETLADVALQEGIRCIEVPMHRKISPLNDLISLCRLIRLFYKEKPFIVHANTPKGSLLAMVASWVTCVPHRIYSVTGLRFETTEGMFRRLLITMEKITCACATKVIPEGEGVKNTLIKNGITHKNLQVILNGNINGIDVEYFSRSEQIMTRARSINQLETFGFVFVGRMVKDKGLNELVRAFCRLYEIYSDVRLNLVGNFERELDPIDADVEQLIENKSAIVAWGYQSDVRHFLAAANVLVFPSYREGFPNVVLQAGAMGLPAIVTDINGCNEIIIEGENGLIIPSKNEEALYDAMKWMYEHSEKEVKDMAKKARPMIVDRYEQRQVWAATLKMYQML